MHNPCDKKVALNMSTSREILFARLVRMLMFFLLAIYPFGLASLEIWRSLEGVLWMEEVQLVAAICALPMIVLIVIWKTLPQQISSGKSVAICIVLFCVSAALRLICCELLQTTPVSDFLLCYEYAATGTSEDLLFLGRHSHLGAYALTLRWLFRMTGPSVLYAQMLNVFVTSIIPILLFVTLKRVTGRGNVAAVAAALYAIFPSMVIYSAVLSCENLAQFYMAAFVCALAYYCTEKNEKKRWMYICIAGLTFAGLCVYKKLFKIVAPAFLMVSFCYEILPLLCRCIKERKFAFQDLARFIIADIIVIALALGLSKFVVREVQNELIGGPYQSNSTFSATVYEGLCIEGNGAWSHNVKQFVKETIEESQNSKEVDRILYGKLYADYKDNGPALFQLLQRKFIINWCEEETYYYWTFNEEGNILQGTWTGDILFRVIPSIWFMVICCVICAGSLLGVIRKDTPEERYFDFIVTGIVFLFALALVIMEAQGRYKSNMSPLICIMFSLCLNRIFSAVAHISKSIQESIKSKL